MMRRFLPVAIALVIMLSGGLVHGWLTDRWSQSDQLAHAVQRLADVPLTIGDWQGAELEALNPAEVAQAELSGYILRRYENRLNQQSLNLLLVCGRPGPIASHTPDICYRGAGYSALGKPIRWTPPEGATLPGTELWVSTFQKQAASGSLQLRVCWSFSADGAWTAPRDARLSNPGLRFLYKFYLIREIARSDEPLAEDPAIQFLPELLPALNRAVFSDLERP